MGLGWIDGFTIKNVTDFVGKEGNCKQGYLYYESKRILFWSDDMNGGEMWFDWFVGDKKRSEIESLAHNISETVHNTFFKDINVLIDLLIQWDEVETAWKKEKRPQVIVFWNNFCWQMRKLTSNEQNMEDDQILNCVGVLKEIADFKEKYRTCLVQIIRDENDLVLDSRVDERLGVCYCG